MDNKDPNEEDINVKAFNESCPFNVITVGNSKVGKTCLILRFFGKQFGTSHLSTIGVDKQMKTIKVDDEKYKFYFWDTTGQERFTALASQYLRKAQGAFFVYSIDDEESFRDIHKWVKSLKDNSNLKKIIMTLIGNKNDLESERKISYENGKKLADELEMDFYETSAKTGDNVETCFKEMVTKVVAENKEMAKQKALKLSTSKAKIKKDKKKCCK